MQHCIQRFYSYHQQYSRERYVIIVVYILLSVSQNFVHLSILNLALRKIINTLNCLISDWFRYQTILFFYVGIYFAESNLVYTD